MLFIIAATVIIGLELNAGLGDITICLRTYTYAYFGHCQEQLRH